MAPFSGVSNELSWTPLPPNLQTVCHRRTILNRAETNDHSGEAHASIDVRGGDVLVFVVSSSPQEPRLVYCWIGDIQVAKFQLFGSLLILTGYRLFLNPYRKVPEVPLQVR
jgi:hypothetical protein